MNTDDIKINLNQNIWSLIVSLAALGTAEFFCLKTLYWFGVILSSATALSLFFTLTFYTINYCRRKMPNGRNGTVMKNTIAVAILLFCTHCSFGQAKKETISKIKGLIVLNAVRCDNPTKKRTPTIYYNASENILDIDGFQVPLNEVTIKYDYNATFKRHSIRFNCKNSSECVIRNSVNETTSSFSVCFPSKAICYQVIDSFGDL